MSLDHSYNPTLTRENFGLSTAMLWRGETSKVFYIVDSNLRPWVRCALLYPGYPVSIMIHLWSDHELGALSTLQKSFGYKYLGCPLSEITPSAARSPPALHHFQPLMYVKPPVMVLDYKECAELVCVCFSYSSEISPQLSIIHTQRATHTFDPYTCSRTHTSVCSLGTSGCVCVCVCVCVCI